ncbi:MAG TPA: LacI family DNA-binding transcriptional regulator [Terracidiphilus sp.]|nr:LacI family DNA-binding transcriptional regulator [Terracidiphilus sp.]
MAIRLKDIAQELGVSTVTVSKVLRGKRDVGARMRALVLKRMSELNYRPNLLARGLASGRSFAAGLVVPDLIHPFFGEFATSLGNALRKHGLALMVSSSREDIETEQRETLALLDRGVDVLLLASCQPAHSTPPVFRQVRTPILLVDRNFPKLKANFVGSDDVAVGKLATRHLLAIGRRRIAHIGVQNVSTSIDRLRGYRETLAEAGVTAKKNYIVAGERFEETADRVGYESMRQLLRLKQPPDAVFCYSDLCAIGAMQAAIEADVRVPQDIAFVGCGNFRYASYLRIPLSSVDHGTGLMGKSAAAMALRLIATPDAPVQTLLLKPILVVRKSSATGAGRRSG